MIAQCLDRSVFGAEIVVVGYCSQPDTFIPALAMLKEVTLKFSAGNNKSDFQFIVDMMAAKRIQVNPLITKTVSFSDLPTAFEALRKPIGQCKVLLEPER